MLLKLGWVALKTEADLTQALKEAPKGKPQALYFMRGNQKVLIPIE
jgi:hypothetical protein